MNLWLSGLAAGFCADALHRQRWADAIGWAALAGVMGFLG